jgi:hypothetical protein
LSHAQRTAAHLPNHGARHLEAFCECCDSLCACMQRRTRALRNIALFLLRSYSDGLVLQRRGRNRALWAGTVFSHIRLKTGVPAGCGNNQPGPQMARRETEATHGSYAVFLARMGACGSFSVPMQPRCARVGSDGCGRQRRRSIKRQHAENGARWNEDRLALARTRNGFAVNEKRA